ncbi:mutL, partial [Symbiodinium sp. KB8]
DVLCRKTQSEQIGCCQCADASVAAKLQEQAQLTLSRPGSSGMDSFQSAISAHLSIAEASATARESTHGLDTTEAWILFAAGTNPDARPAIIWFWGVASVLSVALFFVRWLMAASSGGTSLQLFVETYHMCELVTPFAPAIAMMACAGRRWCIQCAIAAAAFAYLSRLLPLPPIFGNDPKLGRLVPELSSSLSVFDVRIFSGGGFYDERPMQSVLLLMAMVTTGFLSIPCRSRADSIGMVLSVAFPGYVVATTISNESLALVFIGKELECDGSNAGRAKATVIACMAASFALNGISCLLHLEFARQVRAAVPTRAHHGHQTKQTTWWILAAACFLTVVAYAAVLILWGTSRHEDPVQHTVWELIATIGWAALTDFGMWLIASWLVALPHIATCMLLQGELEHVAALVQSAEVVGDLTAAFEACQDCKRRFGWFLVCHFVLDGLSLLTSLAADAVLALRRPAFHCGDTSDARCFQVLLLNLGLNHPQLTAGFLFMQFVSLVAFHEAVEDAVNRRRYSPNDRPIFETLVLRRDELQLAVMGKVLTRRWFARAVLTSMISTMITTTMNFVKSLISESPDAARKLRADIQVPCPGRIAEATACAIVECSANSLDELLIGSLDAGATAVEVELQESSVGAVLTVRDDGAGREMEALGAEALGGGKPVTSLAAVCARCGRVVVRSKVPGQGTVCKIFEQGKVTYLGPSDVPHGGPGSTIRVEGLGRLMREVEVSSLRHRLERQVLIRPRVSLQLRFLGQEAHCLDLVAEQAAARLEHVLGCGCTRGLHRVQWSSDACALEGVVSRLEDAQSTDSFMYLYVNGRYVEPTPIHESIVRLFAAASLHAQEGTGQGPDSVSAVAAGGVWPLFVLNFQCPEDWFDVALAGSVIQFSNWRQPIRFIQMCLRKVWLRERSGEEAPDPAQRAPASLQKHRKATAKRTRCSDAVNIVPLLAQRIAVARGPAAPCQTTSPDGASKVCGGATTSLAALALGLRTLFNKRGSFVDSAMPRRSYALWLGALWSPGPAAAVWPFDAATSASSEKAPELPHGAHLAFAGSPVIVVERHMGHNPWEDLHKNMERMLQQQVAGGSVGSQALMPRPVQMQMQLGGLLDMFGDHHAGHVGLAQGSFQVHDDHETQIVISAVLPGYEFGAASASSEKPLSVRAIRGRSLVISGRHRQGPLISSWQRVFSLPKGSDVGHVSVTYNSGTGNLTVTVPRSNATVAEESEGEENVGMDDMLPPALQALRPDPQPGLNRNLTVGHRHGFRSIHGDVATAIGQQVEQMILQAKKDSEARVRHELNVARSQLTQMESHITELSERVTRCVRLNSGGTATGVDPAMTVDRAFLSQKIKQLEQKWGSEVKALKQDLHRTILAHNHNSDLMRHHRDALDEARRKLDSQPAPKADQVDAQIDKVDRMLRAGAAKQRALDALTERLTQLETQAAQMFPAAPGFGTTAVPPGLSAAPAAAVPKKPGKKDGDLPSELEVRAHLEKAALGQGSSFNAEAPVFIPRGAVDVEAPKAASIPKADAGAPITLPVPAGSLEVLPDAGEKDAALILGEAATVDDPVEVEEAPAAEAEEDSIEKNCYSSGDCGSVSACILRCTCHCVLPAGGRLLAVLATPPLRAANSPNSLHEGGPQGFLRARRPMGLEDVLGQVFGQLDQMHPRQAGFPLETASFQAEVEAEVEQTKPPNAAY